jgi:speckle-type POZ protein
MSTADAIRAQIAAAHRTIQEQDQEMVLADREVEQAEERQQLRRELEQLQSATETKQHLIGVAQAKRALTDEDEIGPHCPGEGDRPRVTRPVDEAVVDRRTAVGQKVVREQLKSSTSVVAKAEYLWEIGEMSWLVHALKIGGYECMDSNDLKVGGSIFSFTYAPLGGDEGTLAILHLDSTSGGVTFRYKIFIRRRGGDFVQWGETGNVCMLQGAANTEFGPDVTTDGRASPQGVFGLSHEALLKSEWVTDDTLAVRFELEVRLPIDAYDCSIPTAPRIEVPSTTLVTDLLCLLVTGKDTDVKMMVEGETIEAHSLILSSRSEVFDKLLNGGMRESMSKKVLVEDCSALIFKALLSFLYTDDLHCMDEAMQKATSVDQGSTSTETVSRVTWLQSVLAVSHKYELMRLQAWCEQKLCECISNDDACSILCQAHLYEAKQLTNACLDFIREHYAAVIVTEKFGTLGKEWPEVMLKINLCMAGVSETSAKPAIEASQRASGKRKRGES